MSMTIECKLKREGGTDATVKGKTYRFRPDELGRHVCEVEDNHAIQRFLSITEAYRPVGDDNDQALSDNGLVQQPPQGDDGLQPGGIDDDIVIDDEDVEGYEEPFEEAGNEPDGENDDETDDPGNELAPTPETSTGDTEGSDLDDDDESLDPEAVKKEWEATFGKKSGNRGTGTMIKQLREADKE